MTDVRCSDCKYFDLNHVRICESHDPTKRENVCKFSAPVATGGMMSDRVTMWPVVDLEDWCGEFMDADIGRPVPPHSSGP